MLSLKIIISAQTARALSKEIGGNGDGLDRALNEDPGWKGRGQQIVMLKATVKHLQGQLRNSHSHSGWVSRRCKLVSWLGKSTRFVGVLHVLSLHFEDTL